MIYRAICVLYNSAILFPDMYNLKYSADVGHGTAGVLLFLQRILLEKKDNFGFFLDNMIFKWKRGGK